MSNKSTIASIHRQASAKVVADAASAPCDAEERSQRTELAGRIKQFAQDCSRDRFYDVSRNPTVKGWRS